MPKTGLDADATTVKYTRGTLQGLTVGEALERANKFIEHVFQTPTAGALDTSYWYNVIDFSKGRFTDMGRLMMTDVAHVKGGEVDTASCTAFYIGKDILATAAHCLTAASPADLAKGKHFAFFYQRYEPAAMPPSKHLDETTKRLRVAVEWWYPSEFPGAWKKGKPHYGTWDWAFVRVNAVKENPESFYSLTESAGLITQNRPLAVCGYPRDFHNDKQPEPRTYVPVYVAASTQHKPNAKAVAEILALHIKKKNGLGEDISSELAEEKDKQLIALGDKGIVTVGASGGPWMLKDAVTDGEKGLVYGISSWTQERSPGGSSKAEIDKEQPALRVQASALISKEMVDIQAHLRAGTHGNFITL